MSEHDSSKSARGRGPGAAYIDANDTVRGEVAGAVSSPNAVDGGSTGGAPEVSQKEIRRTILDLVWPVTVESLLQMGVGFVNTAMVGHLSAAAIGAVGLCGRATMVAWAAFQTASTGGTVLVAQSIGAGDREKAKTAAIQAILFGSLSVCVLAAIYVTAAPWILGIFRPEPDVLRVGTEYLRILSIGLPAVGLMMSAGAGMRGTGDTRTPMAVAVLVNVVNVIGNWSLIYGNLGMPKLGIRGSAIATVVAQWTGAIISMALATSRNSRLGLTRKGPWVIRKSEMKEMLGIGLPASGESMFWQAAAIILTFFITGFGTDALAAHQLGLNAESLSYMPTSGFSIAATALVGQSIGAGRFRLARRYSNELSKLAVAITVVTAGLLFVIPDRILGILTDEAAVISLGVIYLRLMATAQIPQQLSGVLTGVLRGSGDTRSPMYIAATGLWGIRLPLAYVLAFPLKLGIRGVWIGMTIDLFIRFALTVRQYKRMKWL